MVSTGGQKGHLPPVSGGGQTGIMGGGAAAKIFRALRARIFSPSHFFIACSTPVAGNALRPNREIASAATHAAARYS